MTPSVADCGKRDYFKFCENAVIVNAIKQFDQKQHKLDGFLMNLICDLKLENTALLTLTFFQKILVMFHGSAAVERGFSINKECLVEHTTKVCLWSSFFTVRNSSARRKEALAKMTEEKDKVAKTKKRAYEEIRELQFAKTECLSNRKN
ncbi:hypothetical protein PR048_011051 [Dryococelus australis]|uniref:HAT C-terminal dimerisation domain-containing protein n=1 Tax=Dryococelus australis TaxID=614101 RepID=A0ABQ9HKP7_9NEOP|nr:hypothetical protein PR048_011051 [Dryococelus australis]